MRSKHVNTKTCQYKEFFYVRTKEVLKKNYVSKINKRALVLKHGILCKLGFKGFRLLLGRCYSQPLI